MAALLRDGADLDSMERSLLDCELHNEKISMADIVSLDPTRLSLSPPSPSPEKKETIVKFRSSSSTMVVTSNERDCGGQFPAPTASQSAGREGEIRNCILC